MAKKLISSTDLSWLISEELSKRGRYRERVALAVVADEANGWRVVVANRVRTRLSTAEKQRIAEIERGMRLEYQLLL